MSKAKTLTKEIAEQFFKGNDSVDLYEFTSIEDAAAAAKEQAKLIKEKLAKGYKEV